MSIEWVLDRNGILVGYALFHLVGSDLKRGSCLSAFCSKGRVIAVGTL